MEEKNVKKEEKLKEKNEIVKKSKKEEIKTPKEKFSKVNKNVENKKVVRERKENPTKAFIIDQLWQKLAEIDHIYNLKVENKEKLITFTYNGNDYKLDLVQKRQKKQ